MADRAKIDQEADWHWNELIDISKVRMRQTGKDLFASEGFASKSRKELCKVEASTCMHSGSSHP